MAGVFEDTRRDIASLSIDAAPFTVHHETAPAITSPARPAPARERYVTAREAAVFLGYAPKTVMNKYRDGVLPGYKLDNGSVRFLLSELGGAMKSNLGGG